MSDQQFPLMMNDLQGMRVLVTRPHPAGEILCQRIEQHGGKAIHCPTIAFEARDISEINATLNALHHIDWLIFNSPQAVLHSMTAMKQAGLHVLPSVRFAAIGRGTAEALQDAFQVAPIYPETTWNSEGLLALEELQAIKGQHIAIVRGEGGRALLEETFTKRQAMVHPIVVYRRILPVMDIQPISRLFKSHLIDVAIATSCDGVRHFKALFEGECWDAVKTVPLVVISDRIKGLAEDLGFRRIWITREANHPAMLSYLLQKKDVLCQTKQAN